MSRRAGAAKAAHARAHNARARRAVLVGALEAARKVICAERRILIDCESLAGELASMRAAPRRVLRGMDRAIDLIDQALWMLGIHKPGRK